MNWFSNLRLHAKLTTAFAVVLLLSVVVGVLGLVQMSRVNAAAQDLGSNWMPSVRYASSLNGDLGDVRARQFALASATTQDDKDHASQALKKTLDAYELHRKSYEPLISSPEERALYDKFAKGWAAYMKDWDEVQAAAGRGDTGGAVGLLSGEMAKLYMTASDDMDAVVDINVKGGDVSRASAEAIYASGRAWMIGSLLLALVAGITIAWTLAGQLSRPLERAAESARAIAVGDLTRHIPSHGRDEIGMLLQALSDMQQGLSKVVGTVRAGVEHASTASTEIASGNLDLSSRTEQQASSLQQTAASVEQMTSTVKQTSDSAREANQLAVSASQTAVEGGEVVSRVVHTMGEITDSSRKISDIITVIDGIAFQTNILALNAAVEAARAGEQGRGFAVVASEVRSLAQRSAGAAKEIKTLITASVERVEAGSKLVDQAGKTIGDVVQRVKRVADLIAEIDAASREQAGGIGQISQAVSHLDQATQQNAALVEESSAAAESMRDQMQRLSSAVAQFKLNDGHTAAAFASAPAHAHASAHASTHAPRAPAPVTQARQAPKAPAKTKPAQQASATATTASEPAVVASAAHFPSTQPNDADWSEF